MLKGHIKRACFERLKKDVDYSVNVSTVVNGKTISEVCDVNVICSEIFSSVGLYFTFTLCSSSYFQNPCYILEKRFGYIHHTFTGHSLDNHQTFKLH